MSLLGPEPNDKKQAEFVLGLVSKTYDHSLHPFFRGTVVSSRPLGSGQLGYLVKVQRPEGTAPDGMEYLCLIPGYVPAAGDVVDCMWRDERTGYVFAVLQSASGVLTAGAITTSGHVLSTGAAPTAVAGPGAGTGPPAPVVVAGSTDTRGLVTFGTGTAPVAGIYVTVTFAAAYATAPIVVITPRGSATPSNTPVLSFIAVTTASFGVQASAALLASFGNTVYAFNYIVIG